jgi:ribosome maturation protein Sdo1
LRKTCNTFPIEQLSGNQQTITWISASQIQLISKARKPQDTAKDNQILTAVSSNKIETSSKKTRN